jgi:hypothetical protein
LYAANVDVASTPEARAKLHPRPDFSTNVAGSLSGSIAVAMIAALECAYRLLPI